MSSQSDVAKNLRAIEDMAGRLEPKAIDQGRRVGTNDDRGIVGGEAAVNLAPVASIEAWTKQVSALEDAWRADPALDDDKMPNWSEAEDSDEMWPARQLVRYWSERIRKRLRMDYAVDYSLAGEAKFLRNKDVSDWIWDNEPQWDEYAGNIAAAKTALENILTEGDRDERSRVVCPDCDAKRPLIRQWAPKRPTAWQCDGCGERTDQNKAGDDPCPRCGVPAMRPILWASDEKADRWKCPGCRHKFNAQQVDDAFAKQMRSAGIDRWIPVRDALSVMQTQGWQERTVLAWFESEDIELTQDELGRRSVWWPDVWRTHNAARLRRDELEAKADDLRRRKWICKAEHGDDCWIKGRGCAVLLTLTTAV